MTKTPESNTTFALAGPESMMSNTEKHNRISKVYQATKRTAACSKKHNAKAGSPIQADERERFRPRQDRFNATTSFLK